jgi:hypothetical protein
MTHQDNSYWAHLLTKDFKKNRLKIDTDGIDSKHN